MRAFCLRINSLILSSSSVPLPGGARTPDSALNHLEVPGSSLPEDMKAVF